MRREKLILVSGHKGALGSKLIQKANQQAQPLILERDGGVGYPQLSHLRGTTIIHCGAISNRLTTEKNIYRDNYSRTKEIVNYVRLSPEARIIYVSANSLGNKKEGDSCIHDLYSHTKFLSEIHITRNLSPDKYTIIRLPGLYKRGIRKEGFLDKLFYIPEELKHVEPDTSFRNIALIDDVADFLVKIAQAEKQYGHIGNLAAINPLLISQIMKVMDKYRKRTAKISRLKSSNQDKLDASMAFALGFPQRSVISLLSYLYSPNGSPLS